VAKDNRGHLPQLVNVVLKIEKCKACGQERRRGEKWQKECAGAGR
jgi:hypothetical protein